MFLSFFFCYIVYSLLNYVSEFANKIYKTWIVIIVISDFQL